MNSNVSIHLELCYCPLGEWRFKTQVFCHVKIEFVEYNQTAVYKIRGLTIKWQSLHAVSELCCDSVGVLHTAFNKASGLLSSCSAAAALEMALSVSSCRCLESFVGDGCSMYSGSCCGTVGGQHHHQTCAEKQSYERL